MLIEIYVNLTLNAKTFGISLSTIKSLLTKHLIINNGDGSFKLTKGDQFEQIHDTFINLSSLNVCNLVVSFKHQLGGVYINNILELKSMNCYNYIQECCFLSQISSQKVFIFKRSVDGVWSAINLDARM
jgi:hypothetical protein